MNIHPEKKVSNVRYRFLPSPDYFKDKGKSFVRRDFVTSFSSIIFTWGPWPQFLTRLL
jgi:hypothetical protein